MPWLISKPIAHRGLHANDGNAPENSMAAFEKAIEKDYPIELDIRILRDRRVAVFHDDSLKRMTGVDRRLSEVSFEEIKDLRLLKSRESIPLFEAVLSLIQGRVPLLIEIKNKSTNAGELEEELLKILSKHDGEYAVESFNTLVLKWFKINAPHIIRGQLSCDFRDENMPFYRKFLMKNLLLNQMSNPDFIAYDVRCLPYLPVALATRHKPLIGWTTKTHEEHDSAMRCCDNVIFEGYTPVPAKPSTGSSPEKW